MKHPRSLASTSRGWLPFALFAASLPLAPLASAADGTAVGSFVSGAFAWQNTANWVGATVADGVGATATFNNNFTGAVTLSFTNGSTTTLGRFAYTDTTPSNNGFAVQAGTGSAATLVFDDTDGTTNIDVSNNFATNAFQFGTAGTLNIQGTDNLIINNNGSNGAQVRFSTGVNWSGHTGKITLNGTSGSVYQTEAANTLPGAAEIEVGSNVRVRAVFNNSRDQSIKGLSGGDSSTNVGTNDNATAVGTLTLGNGTVSTDSYTYSGNLGADTFTTGLGQENSRFGITKTGAGTQILAGTSSYVGSTAVNAGTLLVNGNHTADTSLGGNLATVTTRGLYTVASGATLGGTGTIKPYDTAGGGIAVSFASGAILAPGSNGLGTLTFDNTASARSILQLSTGSSVSFDLGAGVTSDSVKIIGSSTLATEVFFGGTTGVSANFNDVTLGLLAAGDYLLFDGDAQTGYSGLVLGASFTGASFSGNKIDGGLNIGTGLGSYVGSTLFLSGNDIYLNIIPEPATYGALAGLSALALAAWRRRRA